MNKAIAFAHFPPWHLLVLPFSALDRSDFVRHRRRDAGEVLCVLGRFVIGGRGGRMLCLPRISMERGLVVAEGVRVRGRAKN